MLRDLSYICMYLCLRKCGNDRHNDISDTAVIAVDLETQGHQGRIQEFIWGGGGGKWGGGANQGPQSKVKGEARIEGAKRLSARVLRAKPESRARSARELRAKPEPRAKPEKKRGRGLGRGMSPSPENI